ncbi:MAG: HTH domain-containing protein [Dactylosporangium sp.]|nr:HTH domain-containing protein [Dactylosporangium sp.]NNJ60001.1 HTH domain-containing protein [Dactylosporangium sp.]
MSPPTGRVLALLELLQTLPGATATELAGRLSVDERTVRRDAAHLCDLGIPVRARRGRHGGFRLGPAERGQRLAPLMFTEAEVVAMVLSLACAAHTGLSTGANGDAASASALAKTWRVLPETLAVHVTALLATLGYDREAHPAERPPAATVLALASATARGQRVILGYDGAECVVDPYEIACHRGRWRLAGHDPGTGSGRVFDLDLIEDVRPAGDADGRAAERGPAPTGRGGRDDHDDEG